ncbi:MAG: ketopantoate reductase family protein [Terriglobia bacterium]
MKGNWPRIAVLGAGAVGCYFGGMLARAGAPVTLIGRPLHVGAVARHGLFIDGLHFQKYIPVSASTEISAANDAEVVLFCVKTLNTEEAAKSLVPHLAPNAALISLQNGVDNVERIRAAAKIDAYAAVVYVAAAMTAPGRVKHSGRGDLILGDLPGRAQNDAGRRQVERIASLFERAGVPCRVSSNVEGELWLKMIINCAYNAISALGRAQYHRVGGNRWTRELMIMVTKEALEVARAAGVQLPDVDMVETVLKISESMANATSSTAQDLARGKPTEIDSLNGYLVRRGAEVGVPTPINQTLHALVKLLEESVAS